jgi:hypothetical protein
MRSTCPDPSTAVALAFAPESVRIRVRQFFDEGAKTVGVIASFGEVSGQVDFHVVVNPPPTSIDELRENMSKLPPGASLAIYTKPPTVQNGRQTQLRRVK